MVWSLGSKKLLPVESLSLPKMGFDAKIGKEKRLFWFFATDLICAFVVCVFCVVLCLGRILFCSLFLK